MSVSLDQLIEDINNSQQAAITVYFFSLDGLLPKTVIRDHCKMGRNQDGHLFLGIDDGEHGYLLDEKCEIYLEADPEGKYQTFYEIRQDGLLLAQVGLR